MTKRSRCLPWLLLGWIGLVQAAPLEDVTLQPGQDSVRATIRMSEPVLYLRHFPSQRSRHLEIYYERVKSTQTLESWRDNETREVTAGNDVPGFTVTTRDQGGQPRLVIEFTREADFVLAPSADGRSFVLTLKRDKALVAAPVAAGPLPLLPIIAAPQPMPGREAVAASGVEAEPDYNQQGYQLMTMGRDALAAKDYESAIQLFNRLLLLPPNQYTQDAQEWVGVARERAGQTDKARAEYQLYLKLYTEGPGPVAVRQRLAGLDKPMEVKPVQEEKKESKTRSITQASISSRYYYGKSDIESLPLGTTTWDPSTVSLVDTSFLNTSIDASHRMISDEYDGRVVFRDVWTQNFNDSRQPSRNRINAAYLELKARKEDYSGRLGRQTASGGGVMGRFDGLSASYGTMDVLKTTGVAGQLVDFVAVDTPVFYGVTLERGPASLFLINQTVGSITDRRAVGADLRYFDNEKTAYVMADYDIYFKNLNNVQMNGTWNLSTGTAFNVMGSYSKIVTMRNALIGAHVTSLKDLEPTLTGEALRQLALDRTMGSVFGQIGVTQKLDDTWQVGGDLRMAKNDGLPASGDTVNQANTTAAQGWLDSIAASGAEYTGSLQLSGRNLFSPSDFNSFTMSYIKSDFVTSGQSFMVYNHTEYDRDFSMDVSLRYFRMNYQGDTSTSGVVPMAQFYYQLMEKFTLEGELGYETSTSTTLLQQTNTKRQFFSLGFRWDM